MGPRFGRRCGRSLRTSLAVVLAIAFLSGCFRPDVPDGIPCADEEPACPSGQECDSEGICRLADSSGPDASPADKDAKVVIDASSPPDASPPPDAGPPPDASPPDASPASDADPGAFCEGLCVDG